MNDDSGPDAYSENRDNTFCAFAGEMMRFLSGSQVKVMCALIAAMHPDDYAVTSLGELRRETCLSDRTILRVLRELESLHLLAVDDGNPLDFKCWLTVDPDSAVRCFLK